MNITLNPKYIIKPEVNRALLLTKDLIRAKDDEKIETVIHPVHAIILSFFNGDEFETSVRKASEFLGTNSENILNFVNCLIENREYYTVDIDRIKIGFPKQILIKSDYINKNIPKPEDFIFDKIELTRHRHSTVTDVTLMVTTACATNCIYCYANREKVPNQLSLSRIKELIIEARKNHLRSFDIIGGDVFAYKHWEELLQSIHDNGFNPYLSTKVPLNEQQVIKLKNIGIRDIQVSLDTLQDEKLIKIIGGISGYPEKIRNTLRLLDKYNIETTIHSVIGSYNSTIQDLNSIYKFIIELPNIKKWRLSAADFSLYKSKEEFVNFRSTIDKIKEIREWVKNLSQKNIIIQSGGLSDLQVNPQNLNKKDENFFKNRTLCSANYNHMFILPDGKVTICEQLYWNKNFIIGDVTKLSLAEVWNSDKAKSLYFFDQKEIEKDSYCYSCKMFDECHQEMGGVCWKDIIRCYGEDKWHYPDPRCPKAPDINEDVYIK